MYPDEAKNAKIEELKNSSHLPLSHQEKTVAALHEDIEALTRRLKSILTPMTPAGEPDHDAAEDKIAAVQSPLADQLQANNAGITKASRKIRALMERLEC